jgi:hypothetical protein
MLRGVPRCHPHSHPWIKPRHLTTVRTPDVFLDLLRGRAYGHLATLMSDGAPQLTPVWVDVEDTTDGYVVLVTSKRGRNKNRNMAARPQVGA